MGIIDKIIKGPDLLGVLERVGNAGAAPVAPERKLCLNFRWKQNCSACADACPVSAIDLETLRIDGSRCIACGVCAVACPAGALTFERRARCSILADIDATSRKGGIVIFSCDRCGGAFGRTRRLQGSIVVPCLSMLDEALVLECHARGAREVRLAGCSPRCPFVRGRRIHRDTLCLAEAIRRAVKIGPGPGNAGRGGAPTIARSAEGAGGPGPARSGEGRREFLVEAGRELLRAAYPSGERGERPERWAWLHRLPERREALLELVRGPSAGRHRLRRYGGLQYAEIRADRARCSMCGACGALCPTGAIGTVELDDSSLLYFNPSWCTGCLLCVRSCPEGALSVGESFDLGRLGGSGEVLLRLPAALCPKCRARHIPERTGGECPTCRKEDLRLGPARNARGR